jgi:hypothetical protein
MSEVTVNNPGEDVAAPQPAGLNIQDLISLLSIVDVASRRGAFRAEELSSVGSVYDKVSGFLKSTGLLTDPAQEETATEETN